MTNVNNLRPGQYVKTEESQKNPCDLCGKPTDVTYEVQVAPNDFKKACRDCFKQYWAERGYKV